MAYVRTVTVGPAATIVHVDNGSQHHYTALEVDAMLTTAQADVALMSGQHPNAAWAMSMGELRYTIHVVNPTGHNVEMIFRWAKPNPAQPHAPYLYHIGAPAVQYKQERRKVFARWAEGELKAPVKPDPFAAVAKPAKSTSAQASKKQKTK